MSLTFPSNIGFFEQYFHNPESQNRQILYTVYKDNLEPRSSFPPQAVLDTIRSASWEKNQNVSFACDLRSVHISRYAIEIGWYGHYSITAARPSKLLLGTSEKLSFKIRRLLVLQLDLSLTLSEVGLLLIRVI